MTYDKYAAMLFSLVESCIPEEMLIVRLMNPTSSMKGTTDKHNNKLNLLLSFLRSEADGEEKISMSRVGLRVFEKPHHSGNTKRRGEEEEEENTIPTSLNLLTGEKQSRKSSCEFCGRMHASKDCFQMQKMPPQEKKDAMEKKQA